MSLLSALPTETKVPNVRHSSKTNEHYTPPEVIEAARNTMGSIDLDPASTPLANTLVKAATFFTKKDDGLSKPWHGNVFLNPPGGLIGTHSSAKVWWFKLAREYYEGNVHQAIFLAFSLELLQTSQVRPPVQVLPINFSICLFARRIKFYRKVGGKLVQSTSPSHANFVVYLPPRKLGSERLIGNVGFQEEFAKFGGFLNV